MLLSSGGTAGVSMNPMFEIKLARELGDEARCGP